MFGLSMHTLWLSICGRKDFILDEFARNASTKLHFDPPKWARQFWQCQFASQNFLISHIASNESSFWAWGH